MTDTNPAGPTSLNTDPLLSIRESDEYAAAFDVEVWKAEQKRLFQETLRQELASRCRELELEYAEKDVRRLEDVDSLRRELESMAKRLQTAGASLQHRIANHEKREEAFEARRLRSAQEYEENLQNVQQRHRRQMEESLLRHEQLQTQLREKELSVQQAHQRLAVMQTEYDTLQRFATRLQTAEGEKQTAVSELRQKLEAIGETIKDLQRDNENKANRIVLLEADKNELIAACALYKKQVSEVTEAYNKLTDAVNEERRQLFVREREHVQTMKREHELRVANETRFGVDERVLQQHLTLAAEIPAVHLTMGGGTSSARQQQGAPTSEIQELRRLVTTLQEETRLEEKRRRRQERKHDEHKRRSHDSRKPVLLACGEYPSQPPPRPSPLRVTGDVGSVLYSNGPDHSQQLSLPLRGELRPADGPLLGNVSVSTMSTHTTDDGHSSANNPCNPHNNDNGNFSALTESTSPQNTQTWGEEGEGRGEWSTHPTGSTRLDHSLDTVSETSYTYVDPTVRSFEDSESRSSLQVDFTRRANPAADVRSSWESSKTASSSAISNALPSMAAGDSLADIRTFVSRLQSNRDRLIDTGVYRSDDPLIVEMDHKIKTYRRYVKAN